MGPSEAGITILLGPASVNSAHPELGVSNVLEDAVHLLVPLILISLSSSHVARIWMKEDGPFSELREDLSLYRDTFVGRGAWLKRKLGTLVGCEFCVRSQVGLLLSVAWGLVLWLDWSWAWVLYYSLLLGFASGSVSSCISEFLYRDQDDSHADQRE